MKAVAALAIFSALFIYSLSTAPNRSEKLLVGVTAQCNDGMYSTSKRGRGVCSGHGGVKRWIVE